MIDLDELERLEKAATPGPWDIDEEVWGPDRTRVVECKLWAREDVAEHNERVIVATRNALPALIAELRAARAVITAHDTLACVTCGAERGCNIDCDTCEVWAAYDAATRGEP